VDEGWEVHKVSREKKKVHKPTIKVLYTLFHTTHLYSYHSICRSSSSSW
jgi:hypothetical protein